MTETNSISQNHQTNQTPLHSTQQLISLEQTYGAHNYHPLPIVFQRAKACQVWDPEGNEYIDCLSAYSAVNQGHCHPKIIQALIHQAHTLTLSSRAFYNAQLGLFAKKCCERFEYESMLPVNTGVEAVETALKLARKWSYVKKGVPPGKAIIISADGNFHGRTLGVVGMSTDPVAQNGFGPFLESIGSRCPRSNGNEQRLVRYNVLSDLEAALNAHGSHTAAVLLEPIQGEAGVFVPDDDYLIKVQKLCRDHNVLLILDEVQTGLGRTGKLLCQHHHQGLRADIVTLGKALSGGVYPVSAILADREIMDVIGPGEHGSTFGGNPMACAVATAAIDVLIDEKLIERAEEMGKLLRSGLEDLKRIGIDGKVCEAGKGWIRIVRGKGLLNAIVIDGNGSKKKRGAWELCLLMKSKGVLAKPTHGDIVRLAPPLVISKEEIESVVKVIGDCLKELDLVERIPGLEIDH
ncbi:pyridoxal phosphate-dependent transferase [Melampsora americana]|nr:pyridoxal phosphate-dependent transferase [Melampsora americana]